MIPNQMINKQKTKHMRGREAVQKHIQIQIQIQIQI